MWRNAVSKFISATVNNAKNSLTRPMSAKPSSPAINASTPSLKKLKRMNRRKVLRSTTPKGSKSSEVKKYSILSGPSQHLEAFHKPSETKGVHTNAYLLAYVPPTSKIMKKSPCADPKKPSSNPCGDSKKPTVAMKSPCADPKKPSTNPCGEVNKTPPPAPKSPCQETKKMEAPCPEAKSPCSQAPSPPCGESSMSPSAKNCCHHKDLVPPPSVLSQLKSFELKSDCTSFHMKAEGFECCK